MPQFVVWTSLEAEGLGASLRLQPADRRKVKAEWNIPESWKLIAQMPFGKPVAEPGEKNLHRLKIA